MSCVTLDARPVDFVLCKYGRKNLFHGAKNCVHSYGVCLEGADTFGGKVPDPFCSLWECGMVDPMLNLGMQHSGAKFYIEDDSIHEIIENVQIIFL